LSTIAWLVSSGGSFVKSYRAGVAVALAAAGLALSACSPMQAGAAAIIGKDRITSSDLNSEVRSFNQSLAANKMTEQQLGLSIPLPQMILYRMANAKQFIMYARSKGVTVTQREIDDVVAARGGQAQLDKILLANGIPPSQRNQAISALVVQDKLMGQLGAGSDEQSQQAAFQKLSQQADEAVPVKYSPRFGKWDAQQGLVPDDRFGSVIAPAEAAPAAAAPAGS
jgi:hypothetical protein